MHANALIWANHVHIFPCILDSIVAVNFIATDIPLAEVREQEQNRN